MKKLLLHGKDARAALLNGAEKLARIVGGTMGPMGRNVVFDPSPGYPNDPQSTRDGVTAARWTYLEGFEDTGNRMIRQAAAATVKSAGDGTSATVVLAHAIYKAGLEELETKSIVEVERSIKRDVETVCAEIDKMKVRVQGQMVEHVATIAVNNDPVLGKIVVDAQRKAGPNGVVAVEDSLTAETTMEHQEGMQWKEGYISALFVNVQDRQIVEFFDPLILLLDRPLSSLQGMLPMMEGMCKQARPLLILAEDVTGEALATLVSSKLKGILQVCCVKLPSNLGHRKDLLLDIAALTGGNAIIQELGLDVSTMKPSDLGQCRRVVVSSSETRIIGGKGTKEAVSKRVEQIKGLLGQEPTALEKERLQERLGKLTGGVTVLKLGAQTGLELGDRKARVEDACLSTRCALEDGIVPGGGFTLAHISLLLPDGIVKKAASRPMYQILENAGYDDKVLIGLNADEGFNSLTGEKGNLVEMGVIDPAKVVKSALRNAASVAAQMLLTDTIIQQVIPEQ